MINQTKGGTKITLRDEISPLARTDHLAAVSIQSPLTYSRLPHRWEHPRSDGRWQVLIEINGIESAPKIVTTHFIYVAQLVSLCTWCFTTRAAVCCVRERKDVIRNLWFNSDFKRSSRLPPCGRNYAFSKLPKIWKMRFSLLLRQIIIKRHLDKKSWYETHEHIL